MCVCVFNTYDDDDDDDDDPILFLIYNSIIRDCEKDEDRKKRGKEKKIEMK